MDSKPNYTQEICKLSQYGDDGSSQNAKWVVTTEAYWGAPPSPIVGGGEGEEEEDAKRNSNNPNHKGGE